MKEIIEFFAAFVVGFLVIWFFPHAPHRRARRRGKADSERMISPDEPEGKRKDRNE